MTVSCSKISTCISPAFQTVDEERNSRVSSGPQSDDCFVMEQIQLHETLDSCLIALALLNLFRDSQKKKRSLSTDAWLPGYREENHNLSVIPNANSCSLRNKTNVILIICLDFYSIMLFCTAGRLM